MFTKVFLLGNVLPAAIVLVLGAIAVKLVVKAEEKVLAKNAKTSDPLLVSFVTKATSILLWVVIILEACKLLGISTTSLLTVFAACGAAVALALQGSLSNLASGILMMFTHPFKKGDYVVCGGIEGSIDSVDLLYTTVVTVDNKCISVPNSQFTSNAVTNVTKFDTRRVDLRFAVAYDTDLKKAQDVIMGTAKGLGLYLDSPEMTCNIAEYAASAIVFEFRGWCRTSDYWGAYFAMNNAVKPALDAAGVKIPFTQIDIHTK